MTLVSVGSLQYTTRCHLMELSTTMVHEWHSWLVVI